MAVCILTKVILSSALKNRTNLASEFISSCDFQKTTMYFLGKVRPNIYLGR